jgi:dTDP-4-amino-4,6-dideoxygalactose transaminase
MAALEQEDIFARRYFYPTLNSLEYIHTPGTTPVADHISQSILCLPLYFGLEDAQIDRISAIIVRRVEQFRAQG